MLFTRKVYSTKAHLRLRIANICIFNICTSSLVAIDDSSVLSMQLFNALSVRLFACVRWISDTIDFLFWRGCSIMASRQLEKLIAPAGLILREMRLTCSLTSSTVLVLRLVLFFTLHWCSPLALSIGIRQIVWTSRTPQNRTICCTPMVCRSYGQCRYAGQALPIGRQQFPWNHSVAYAASERASD